MRSFKSNKVRALLAYLAVEANRPHCRQVLAGLLWPEWPDRTALCNLRYTLSNLRKVIGDRTADPPFLLITRDRIQFNTASDYSLDVGAFERQVAHGQLPIFYYSPATISCQPLVVNHLQSAVNLHRGSFLEGFFIDSAPFEEWALLKREQLERQLIDALHYLAVYYEQHHMYGRALPYARRLLALEPWDEETHRQLMRLLALGGRRGAALAQYQTCCRVLAKELEVEPTDETTALYEQIRDGIFPNQVTGRQGDKEVPPSLYFFVSPPLPISPSSFVARERELAQLDSFLDLALAGQGRVAFVTGDVGSGKTALMDEFGRRAMAKHPDLVVANGQCNAHAGIGDSCLPFREILRMLTGDIEARRASGAITPEHACRLWALFPDAVQALVDKGADLIGRILPGKALALRAEAFAPGSAAWRTRLEGLVQRQGAETEQANSTPTDLCEQVTRVLQTLAGQHPLLLLLDDLQWADGGTLSLLFHLGRRLAGHRILIVAAYRPVDPAFGREGERHPLVPIRNELQRHFGDVQVDLNQADGRQFVAAFLDAEPNRLGAAFRDTLYRHTAGNPLFTIELVRGLRERGDLVQDEAGQWVEGPALDWDELPARVEAVMAERIGRLPADWRQMLTVASVEGEEFTAEVVARVQGVDEGQVIRCLSGPLSKQHHLVTAHRVRPVAGRCLSRYRFQHILLQHYLYGRLDEVERARLHQVVGTALEALYGEEVGDISDQLARLFRSRGDDSQSRGLPAPGGEPGRATLRPLRKPSPSSPEA